MKNSDKTIDKPDKVRYNRQEICAWNFVPQYKRKDIEVVITALTRNQVYGNVSWVRIPLFPPLVNNTNTETKSGFVLFFSNEYFGIKVDLDGKKKNQPGV